MPSTNHDSAVRQSSRVAALRGLGRDGLVAAAELAAIGLGVALLLTGRTAAADLVLALAVLGALVPLTWGVARTVIGGHAGVDTIALIAMAGALALGEYLAGAVIALMLSGGNALERLAEGRARRELSALLDRAPRIARKRAGTELVEVGVDAVEPGDVLVVRPGEAVPVDGIVLSDAAVLDESSLTGEPVPVDHPATAAILSGTTNAGPPFEMRASRRAADSAYAAIVRIVEQASVQRAKKLVDRAAALNRGGGDRGDLGEHVLNPVVQLGDHQSLRLNGAAVKKQRLRQQHEQQREAREHPVDPGQVPACGKPQVGEPHRFNQDRHPRRQRHQQPLIEDRAPANEQDNERRDVQQRPSRAHLQLEGCPMAALLEHRQILDAGGGGPCECGSRDHDACDGDADVNPD